MSILLDTVSRKRAILSEKRISICNACDHYSKRTTRCDMCGCFMNFKTRLWKAECPIGLWGKEEDNGESITQSTIKI